MTLLRVALWAFIATAATILAVTLIHGGMPLAVRSVCVGLLLVTLVPASQFLFGRVLGVWDWARGRTARHAERTWDARG